MICENHLKPLLDPLETLQKLLDHYIGRSIVIGGIASSLIGEPRLTAHLDALVIINNEEIQELVETARSLGLDSRIKDVHKFAEQNRVVLLRHTDSGTNIDISLGMLPFEKEMISRSTKYQVGDFSITLPSPEDLIIMKAIANRQKDILDIQGIIKKIHILTSIG